MIERCGDRQRKYDGLQKWHFHLFIESLPIMLQVALLLLACGLCRHMWSINASVAYILIVLTALGILFYTIIVVLGTSSYECPFQTPASIALRSSWREVGPHVIVALHPIATAGAFLQSWALTPVHHLWKNACRIVHCLWKNICQIVTLPWSFLMTRCYPQSPPLPITQPAPQQPTPWLAPLHSLWESIECKILLIALRLPQPLPPPMIQDTSPWLKHEAMLRLQDMNANDVRCVSWILWNITDPKALNIATQMASTIQWFEGGPGVEPPYNLIVSALKACFDSTGKIYPGLRDRAYYSAQSILWIHICATCVSAKCSLKFPLPIISHDAESLDHDLKHLLNIYNESDTPDLVNRMHGFIPGLTPAYLQWSSNALLHLSWAKQRIPHTHHLNPQHDLCKDWNANPLDAMLNRLLSSCIFLGWYVEEEVLKIQDKSYVISHLYPSSYLYHCLLVIVLTRSYLSSPRQWLKPYGLLTLNPNSSNKY